MFSRVIPVRTIVPSLFFILVSLLNWKVRENQGQSTTVCLAASLCRLYCLHLSNCWDGCFLEDVKKGSLKKADVYLMHKVCNMTKNSRSQRLVPFRLINIGSNLQDLLMPTLRLTITIFRMWVLSLLLLRDGITQLLCTLIFSMQTEWLKVFLYLKCLLLLMFLIALWCYT